MVTETRDNAFEGVDEGLEIVLLEELEVDSEDVGEEGLDELLCVLVPQYAVEGVGRLDPHQWVVVVHQTRVYPLCRLLHQLQRQTLYRAILIKYIYCSCPQEHNLVIKLRNHIGLY